MTMTKLVYAFLRKEHAKSPTVSSYIPSGLAVVQPIGIHLFSVATHILAASLTPTTFLI